MEKENDECMGMSLFNKDAVVHHFVSPYESHEYILAGTIYTYVLSNHEHKKNTTISFFELNTGAIALCHLSADVSPGEHISYVQTKYTNIANFVVLKNDMNTREEKTIIPPNIILYNFNSRTNILETAEYLRRKMKKKQRQFERQRCHPIIEAEFDELISQLLSWDGRTICSYAKTYRCSCYLFLFLGMFYTLRLYKTAIGLPDASHISIDENEDFDLF
jgi:hypothetical protein